MSIKVDVNSILQSDNYLTLERGKHYSFTQKNNLVFFDNTSAWLIKNDWTAQAEISVVSQTIEQNMLKGTFRVDYIYDEMEQQSVTNMFIRMYGGPSDPFIYLLSSLQEYNQALCDGQLSRDSIAEEGFIHAAPKSQLTRLANKYHIKTDGPLILVVNKKKVIAPIKWEPATGGLYPHIYGTLNVDAIVEANSITLNEAGKYAL